MGDWRVAEGMLREERGGPEAERQSGWCRVGELSGLGSVQIHLTDLNVVQELVKAEFIN